MNVFKLFLLLKLVSVTQIKDVTSTLQKVNRQEQIISVEISSSLARKKPKETGFQRSWVLTFENLAPHISESWVTVVSCLSGRRQMKLGQVPFTFAKHLSFSPSIYAHVRHLILPCSLYALEQC